MALPKKSKKIVDVNAAVQKAAEQEEEQPKNKQTTQKRRNTTPKKKTPSPAAQETVKNRPGRPSPRPKGSVKQGITVSQETAERITMAVAREKIQRGRKGEKVDKSLILEEVIIAWLDKNKY